MTTAASAASAMIIPAIFKAIADFDKQRPTHRRRCRRVVRQKRVDCHSDSLIVLINVEINTVIIDIELIH